MARPFKPQAAIGSIQMDSEPAQLPRIPIKSTNQILGDWLRKRGLSLAKRKRK